MGSMSIIHWIILGALVLLVFGGKNKISDIMGDLAKGIKSFKKGLNEDDETKTAARPVDPVRTIDHYPTSSQPQSFANQPAQPVPHADTEPHKVG